MDNQPQQENHPSEKQRKVFPWIRIFFSSKWLFSILVGLMVAELVCTGIYVFAAPPASPYNPGEILDPTCAPLDPNCTTVPPLYNSSTGTGTANIGVGNAALSLNTIGYDNTAVGYQSLYNSGKTVPADEIIDNIEYTIMTVGDTDFTAIGASSNTVGEEFIATGPGSGSGTAAPTPRRNTAFGTQALYSNFSGSYNTATGYQALYSNTTGFMNTANGISALRDNTTGYENVAIGTQALILNTIGGDNTAIGHYALESNISGSKNTALGSYSLYHNTADENVAIGAEALYTNSTGTSNTAVGFQALQTNTTGSSNVAVGYGTLYSNESGGNNIAIGDSALFSNTESNNIAIGGGALYANTTGYYNIAIGHSALTSNITGFANTAFGQETLFSNTDGYDNTAIGWQALFSNETGNYNTAVGVSALATNTTADYNTAVGYYALNSTTTGYENTANGYWALYSNTTGLLNTGLGASTLFSNTDGYENTAVGYKALFLNDTGYDNTGVGVYSLLNNTSGINNTAIGYRALGSVTGNSNIGIGSYAGFYESGSDTFYLNDRLWVNNTEERTNSLLYGNFSGTPASQMLRINAATIEMPYLPTADNTAVHIDGSGNLTKSTSSLRYKHDIQPLAENWTVVLQLQPKSFKYNGTNQSSVGYIAEDFEALGLKDLLVYDNEGKPDAIKYEKLSLYSIEILKQQQIEINALKQYHGFPTDNTAINPAGTLGSGEVSGVNLSSIDQSVKLSLANLGATLSGGIISLKQVITENLTAKTARVEKMEIVDSATGDIYCTWVSNGNWQKAKGDCASITSASATETVVTSATTAQVFQQVTEQQQVAQEIQQVTQEAQQATQQAQQAAQEAQQAAQEVQQAQEQIEEAQPQVLNIASVNVIPNINVAYGTALASANLPATVSATLSDNTTQTLTIVWDNGMPSYDPNTAGTYVFFGTLTLPENVTNTDNINATVNVVVASQPQEEPTVLESVSGLIQSAVASLLNGAWNFVRWLISLGITTISSVSIF